MLHLDERYAPASESAPPLSMETPADLVGSSPDVVQRRLTQRVPRHQDPQGAQGAGRGAAVVPG
ncbi:hypothetical protein [Nonomuraea jabiensis]|uniref:Uncharacterized protein n=1 Tax=Nonomuraea jabiensis TaxID=882448 RepID=A0A7W9LAP4_9ACTN|nr:hypothetical protein [Nonomuraea jabiensis]MBB5776831.1 hypothetical protein [Nonomuraea jabiensis]